MSATTSVSTRRSPILGWAIWLFAVAFCLTAVYELHRQLFWIEICVLLSIAIALFWFAVPTKRRSWAFIIALVFVTALWIGTVIDMILTSINFPENGIAQKLGLTAGSIAPVSAILGLVVALLLAGATVLLASVIAAEHILLFRPEIGQCRWKTEWDLLRSTLGRDARYGIVENGEFKPTSPRDAAAMATAPGTVTISAGHAVIFERRGEVSQISGPGSARLRPEEQCRHIVRLGPRSISFTCDGALTKDGIPLVVRGTLVGAIEEETTFLGRKENCAPLDWHWHSPFKDETDKTGKVDEIPKIAKTDNVGKANETPNAANPDNEGKANEVADTAKTASTSKINDAPETAKADNASKANQTPNAANPDDEEKASEVADTAKFTSTSKTNDAPETAKADNAGKPNQAPKIDNPQNGGEKAHAGSTQIVTDGEAKYHKISILRAAYLPPASGLDQTLQEAAVCLVREVIATRPFDQIVGHPSTKQDKPSMRVIAEEVQHALGEQTAYWGIELSQFRIDRIELPEAVQTEILENWKQALRGRVTSDEARAQAKFLAVLRRYEDSGSFGHMANAFITLFGTSSRIVGITSRAMGLEGMTSLNAALRGLVEKIDQNEPAAKKLPEALTEMSSKL